MSFVVEIGGNEASRGNKPMSCLCFARIHMRIVDASRSLWGGVADASRYVYRMSLKALQKYEERSLREREEIRHKQNTREFSVLGLTHLLLKKIAPLPGGGSVKTCLNLSGNLNAYALCFE